jgi:glutamate/tyrosine decarboxylase-like PLP-dependent enzyme
MKISCYHSLENQCDPEEVGLKSFFLGPQAENGPWVRKIMEEILDRWFEWRRGVFPADGSAISVKDQGSAEFQNRQKLLETATRNLLTAFEREVPKFSPRYIGHMFSEVALPAMLGHFVALLHNPNNISRESSHIGILVEEEAIRALLKMVGFDGSGADGHFTSGGTIANFEALVRARARCADWLARGTARGRRIFESAHMGWSQFSQFANGRDSEKEMACHFAEDPFVAGASIYAETGETFLGPVVLIPNHKHYSWKKGVSLLGLGRKAFWSLDVDKHGRLSLPHLRKRIEEAYRKNRPILLVASVVGTTELGQVDPVAEIQDCLDRYKRENGWHIWHHVDAAYGGFFACLDSENREICSSHLANSLKAMAFVDSLTLDPHKLGYVPYASGSILVRDPRDYRIVPWHAPYIQFEDRDKGPFSLEGSRPATGASATWMIANTVGFNAEGYGRILARTIKMRKNLSKAFADSGYIIRQIPHMDTNIIGFHLAKDSELISLSNSRTEEFIRWVEARKSGVFMLSKTSLNWECYQELLRDFVSNWDAEVDCQEVVLIRIVLMNVFFDSNEMATRFSEELIEAIGEFLSARG